MTAADVIDALGDDAPSAPTTLVVEVVERLIEPRGNWMVANFVAKRDEIRDGGADSVQAVLFSFLRDKAHPRKPFTRAIAKPRRLAAVEGIAAAVEGARTAVVQTEEDRQRKLALLADFENASGEESS
ncbi:hypothetical protein ASG90_02365 [Nocardioides sp. Soil797]|nr:hypothetical protein ASG90_02365 [Nocardioides sp. Soil797]